MFSAIMTNIISPEDVLTIYLSFIGTYTNSQLQEIKNKLIDDNLVNVIEVVKPVFRDLRIVVTPIRKTNPLFLADYIKQVVDSNLRYATSVKISGTDIKTKEEYREAQKSLLGKIGFTGKPPLEMLTGISGTHILLLLAGLGAFALWLYKPRKM